MKEEVKNGVILAISVIIIIVIVYFATAIFMTGEYGNKTRKTTTTSTTRKSYDNLIMASKIFERSEEEYMVMLFSKNNSSSELYDSVTKYSGDTKLYIVNLDEPLNKYLKSNEDNLFVNNSDELKVKTNALLTIKDKVVVGAETNNATIISLLK